MTALPGGLKRLNALFDFRILAADQRLSELIVMHLIYSKFEQTMRHV